LLRRKNGFEKFIPFRIAKQITVSRLPITESATQSAAQLRTDKCDSCNFAA
jgi:hypothetical protein